MPSSTSTNSSVPDDLPPDVEKQPESVNQAQHNAPTGSDKDERSARGGTRRSGDEWAVEPEPEVLDTEAEGMAGVLNRVLSRISTNASWNPGPPPDGGRDAWLCAFCAHLVIMDTWGVVNSFGVFQSYYTTILDRSASDISWIGSIQVFLTFFIGTFTGRFTDAGFFRPVLLVGTCFVTLGIFTASVATQYWQLVLSQGLCMGIGNGFLFTPVISVVSTYFEKKRSLAMGLTASGSTTGGLIYPAMARQLIPSIGLGWALRAIGFILVGTLIFANMVMKPRLPPRRAGSLVEWSAFKEMEYTFYAVGMFFNFWSVYFGFYYISAYCRTAVTPVFNYVESLNVLLVVNGVGFAGRLIPNHYADRFGPLTIMAPFCLITGIALLAWMAVRTRADMYVWVVFYGLAAGAIQSLFPAGLSSLTTDLSKRGTRLGMTFTIVSFAVLTGSPIAGQIITRLNGEYWGAQLFTGISILVGSGFIVAARVAKQRRLGTGWRTKV